MPKESSLYIPAKINKLKIRKAKFFEMTTIAAFIRSSSEWYKKIIDEKDLGEHEVGDKWIGKNYFRREFFLGHNGDEDIGTLSMQKLGGFAYLGYIYLDTKHVGKGYGHELMEFAKRRAKELGLKGLVLIAHPDAQWAVNAYRKFGFKVIAESKSDVLDWQDGALKPYYEEGFQLYRLSF